MIHDAYTRAVALLRLNLTPYGFIGAYRGGENYEAIVARDACICSLAALLTDDEELRDGARRSFETFAQHQTRLGLVPNGVWLPGSGGRTAAEPYFRGVGGIAFVDPNLWFVILAQLYAQVSGDADFVARALPAVHLAMAWLAHQDPNQDGLLEVPESSDWADIFPRSFQVLHAETLWYRSLLAYAGLLAKSDALAPQPQTPTVPPATVSGGGTLTADSVRVQAADVREKILRAFWPTPENLPSPATLRTVYDGKAIMALGQAKYLLSHITPFGFSWRCDVLANVLAGLFGLLDQEKADTVFRFLWSAGVNHPYPVRVLYPVIYPGDPEWKDYLAVRLLNLPYQYHNAGIWPYVGGFWVAFLQAIGREKNAREDLAKLAEAVKLGLDEEWEFNEFLHGESGRPMGRKWQAWTAAGYIIAYHAVERGELAWTRG